MASAVKKCRVCGKEYEACRSANRAAGVFRWQEVACSPECGAVYLQRINESRGIISPQKKAKHRKFAEIAAEPVAERAEEQTVVDTEPISEEPVGEK